MDEDSWVERPARTELTFQLEILRALMLIGHTFLLISRPSPAARWVSASAAVC